MKGVKCDLPKEVVNAMDVVELVAKSVAATSAATGWASSAIKS
jgi:hypothetical protein